MNPLFGVKTSWTPASQTKGNRKRENCERIGGKEGLPWAADGMAGRAEEGWATKPLNSWNEEPRSDSDAMEDVTAAAAAIVCAPAVLQSYHLSVKSSASAPARNAMQLQPALALGAESVGCLPVVPSLSQAHSALSSTPSLCSLGLGEPWIFLSL